MARQGGILTDRPEGWPGPKRSQTISLLLLCGAGAAAIGLGALDPSQREEDVLVYPSAEACAAGRIRTDADCRRDYATARAAYPSAAPRYSSEPACESHHGRGHCLADTAAGLAPGGRYLPVMAGYVIGRRAEQDLPPQPVFDHAPEAAGHGGGGGYCTGSGGRIATGSGGRSASARVSSAAVRPVSFGGFGATGRAHSSGG
ncbi:DUF1190 domain-containing protein [Methylobacterium durans]|uniref:DUF1190 domain-containing protein n=1 Tax=Methylobacterium durans TaxID=2202825 RepID=A0A2U8W8C7_9HYPH|nr:DUF1190 domain-containing protein [Methylobacterium durans]AWN41858.1 hypothetical protein DK389_16805 [Methylobacterium durans]